MRMPLVAVLLLASLAACKKETLAPVTCTMAFREIAAPDRCEAECFAGNARACDVASSQFVLGILTRRDPGRALAIAKKGCELGGAESCASAATVTSGMYDGLWPDGGVYEDESLEDAYVQKAKMAAESECAGGSYESCHRLGLILLNENRPEFDPARAKVIADRGVSLARKACTSGDGVACDLLGLYHRTGSFGLARDKEKERELYEKACAAGHAEGCQHAYFYAQTDDASQLARGCALGMGRLCTLSATRLDEPERTRLLERACRMRSALGCRTLAEDAKGEEAQRLLRRACALGDEFACEN